MARLALLAALTALAATPAAAAPFTARSPRFWVSLEGLFAEPGGAESRGPGGGLKLGVRLTDQLSTGVGFQTLFAKGGPVTALSAGFEAMLDATPIAPFIEISVVRVDPIERVGFSLAQRSGFGADVRVAPGVAIGALVRYVTALDPTALQSTNGLSGLEFALRVVVIPGMF